MAVSPVIGCSFILSSLHWFRLILAVFSLFYQVHILAGSKQDNWMKPSDVKIMFINQCDTLRLSKNALTEKIGPVLYYVPSPESRFLFLPDSYGISWTTVYNLYWPYLCIFWDGKWEWCEFCVWFLLKSRFWLSWRTRAFVDMHAQIIAVGNNNFDHEVASIAQVQHV
jgi:hypothetical protein